MSCGAASVSSRTAVTSDIIREGTNGFLASSPAEWLEKLTLLLDSADMRSRMGARARESLAGVYDTRTIARAYSDLFTRAVSPGSPAPFGHGLE